MLAVAGSGKSTTMAHRIKHLVLDLNISPSAIQVLMFNNLARKQFKVHLDKVGLPENLQPSVHTFHSFAWKVINQCIREGILPASTQFWLADKAELIFLTVKRAIANLEKERRILPESVDPEIALLAISRWKGALIPPDPERASSHTSLYLPLVYQEFEKLRLAENALTFDDFIPVTINIFEDQSILSINAMPENYDTSSLMKYQDQNFGQQCLIELLAGEQSDIMVVGDDDQTIYEWRGARPRLYCPGFCESIPP